MMVKEDKTVLVYRYRQNFQWFVEMMIILAAMHYSNAKVIKQKILSQDFKVLCHSATIV